MSVIGFSCATLYERVEWSRTGLHSHANICVVGRHFVLLNRSRKSVDVNTFAPTIEILHHLQIVDEAISYGDPYDVQCCSLVTKHTPYVCSIDVICVHISS